MTKMRVFAALAVSLVLIPATVSADIVTYDWISDKGPGVPGTLASGSLTYDTTTHTITSFSFVTPYTSFGLDELAVRETFFDQYTTDSSFNNYRSMMGLTLPIGVANPSGVNGGYTSGNDTGISDYFLVLTGVSSADAFDQSNPNNSIHWSFYQNMWGQYYYAKNQGNSDSSADYYGWWVLQPKAPPSATPVPEASTIIAGALVLLPLGFSVIRIIRKPRIV